MLLTFVNLNNHALLLYSDYTYFIVWLIAAPAIFGFISSTSAPCSLCPNGPIQISCCPNSLTTDEAHLSAEVYKTEFILRVIAEVTIHGLTVKTSILERYQQASTCDKQSSNTLVALQLLQPVNAAVADPELRLIIPERYFLCIILGMNNLLRMDIGKQFIFICLLSSSKLLSVKQCGKQYPTLLTNRLTSLLKTSAKTVEYSTGRRLSKSTDFVMIQIFGLIFESYSLALSNFDLFRLTRIMLNCYFASYLAIEKPIPYDPPVTKAHPPPYLFARFSLLRKKGPNSLNANLPSLATPTKKQIANIAVRKESKREGANKSIVTAFQRFVINKLQFIANSKQKRLQYQSKQFLLPTID